MWGLRPGRRCLELTARQLSALICFQTAPLRCSPEGRIVLGPLSGNPYCVISMGLLLLNRLRKFCPSSITSLFCSHYRAPATPSSAAYCMGSRHHLAESSGENRAVAIQPPLFLSTHHLVPVVQQALGILGVLASLQLLANRGRAQGCPVLLWSLWVPFHLGCLSAHLKIQQQSAVVWNVCYLTAMLAFPPTGALWQD